MVLGTIRNPNFALKTIENLEKYSIELRKLCIDWETLKNVTIIKFNRKPKRACVQKRKDVHACKKIKTSIVNLS